MKQLWHSVLVGVAFLTGCAADHAVDGQKASMPDSPGWLGPLRMDAWTETRAGAVQVTLRPLVQLEKGDYFDRPAASRNGSGEVALCTSKKLFVLDQDFRVSEYQLPSFPEGLSDRGATIDVLGTPEKARYIVFRECGAPSSIPVALQACDPLSGKTLLQCAVKEMVWGTGGSVPDEHGDIAGVAVTERVEGRQQTILIDRSGVRHQVAAGGGQVVGHVPGAALIRRNAGLYSLKMKEGKPLLEKVYAFSNGDVVRFPQRWASESFSIDCQDGPFGMAIKEKTKSRYVVVSAHGGGIRAEEQDEVPASLSRRIAIRKDGVDQAVAWAYMEVPSRSGTGSNSTAAPGEAQLVLRIRQEGASNDTATEFRRLPFGSPGLLCNSKNGAVLFVGDQAWQVVAATP